MISSDLLRLFQLLETSAPRTQYNYAKQHTKSSNHLIGRYGQTLAYTVFLLLLLWYQSMTFVDLKNEEYSENLLPQQHHSEKNPVNGRPILYRVA